MAINNHLADLSQNFTMSSGEDNLPRELTPNERFTAVGMCIGLAEGGVNSRKIPLTVEQKMGRLRWGIANLWGKPKPEQESPFEVDENQINNGKKGACGAKKNWDEAEIHAKMQEVPKRRERLARPCPSRSMCQQ